MESPPLVSVVVPTYNRAAVLPYLLDALAGQDYPSERMEVVIVDNSSTDGTGVLVAEWGSRMPFPVSFHVKENRGPAASRNLGAARARGDLIAFTDSDCVPVPGWLSAGARRFAEGAGLVCGPICPRPRPGGPGLRGSQLAPVTRDDGLYPTANLFVARAALQGVGGFDEDFGLYPWGELVAGEDSDLAWRVKRAGAAAVFEPLAAVDHLSTPMTNLQLLLRPVRSQILPRLVRGMPELRRTYLFGGYFVNAGRPLFYLAWLSVAAAVATRLPVLALGAAPALARHLRGTAWSLLRVGNLPKAAAWLAIVLYFEAATTLALLVGSVRHRRLVL